MYECRGGSACLPERAQSRGPGDRAWAPTTAPPQTGNVNFTFSCFGSLPQFPYKTVIEMLKFNNTYERPSTQLNTLSMNSNSTTINITFLDMHIVCMFARPFVWRLEAGLSLEPGSLTAPTDLQFHLAELLVQGIHLCIPLTGGCHACLFLRWFGGLDCSSQAYKPRTLSAGPSLQPTILFFLSKQ